MCQLFAVSYCKTNEMSALCGVDYWLNWQYKDVGSRGNILDLFFCSVLSCSVQMRVIDFITNARVRVNAQRACGQWQHEFTQPFCVESLKMPRHVIVAVKMRWKWVECICRSIGRCCDVIIQIVIVWPVQAYKCCDLISLSVLIPEHVQWQYKYIGEQTYR